MSNLNRFQFLGQLTKDVELKGEGDSRSAILNIVTNDGYKDSQTGKWVETAEFHRVTTFVPFKIDYLARHGKKGAGIYAEGKISNTSKGEGEDRKFYTNFTVGLDGVVTITRYAEDREA